MSRIRLILSGGSGKGMLECAGAVNALADRGHEIAIGAGTSAGGVILGVLAAGRTPVEVQRILMARNFTKFISTGWRAWVRLATRGVLSNGRAYLAFLREITRGRRFRDADFDLRLTGSDYSAGAPRVFSIDTDPDMEIALAMRITSAIPLGFAAVEYQGRWYKDGGVYAHVPVEAGMHGIARTVIFALAQPPGGIENLTRWRATVGLVREVERAVDLLVDANVEAQLSRAPEDAVKIFSDGLGHGTLKFDFTAAEKQALHDHGYGLMAAALQKAGL